MARFLGRSVGLCALRSHLIKSITQHLVVFSSLLYTVDLLWKAFMSLLRNTGCFPNIYFLHIFCSLKRKHEEHHHHHQSTHEALRCSIVCRMLKQKNMVLLWLICSDAKATKWSLSEQFRTSHKVQLHNTSKAEKKTPGRETMSWNECAVCLDTCAQWTYHSLC